jgi:acetolactate synthase-1/2/3 large subunit
MEISKAEMASAATAANSAASSSSPVDLRGGEILVKALQAENVKYIWGYPGGAVLHIYDAFFKQDTIQHVLVRHEQAAVHAADGYARATGDVGVALVTSGPGLTNAVTGIATAYMDSIPMVIISGQVPTAAIGLDAFQECDTVGITRPIVKHNFLVKDARHGHDHEEGIPHSAQWPTWPGGGRRSQRCFIQQGALSRVPRNS